MTSASSPGTRERSLLIAFIFCLLDVALMGSAAYLSNSLAILSDLLKETTDLLSVLAAFLTIRAVRRSPDHRFAYGIGKLENLVSLSIGFIMLGSALWITWKSAHHLISPRMAHGTIPGICIFTIYTFIGYRIYFRARQIAQKQPSAIMESQASLWFSKATFDALMGSSLLVAYLFRNEIWSWYLDPIASLVGVLFMLHAAWAITSSSVNDLLDATLEETTQLRILRQIVLHLDDYERLHKIRTRRSGHHIYVEIFLEFDPNLLMGEVQDRIHKLQRSIVEIIPGSDVSILPCTEETSRSTFLRDSSVSK
jgi:cation diffusion facilitator family transporter